MVEQLVLFAIQVMEFHILSQFLKVSPSMLVLADLQSLEEVSPIIFNNFLNCLTDKIEAQIISEK